MWRRLLKIELLHFQRGGFQDDLELQMFHQPEGIFPVAAVGGTPAGLDVGHPVGAIRQDAEEGLGMEGAGADLEIVGLDDGASPAAPKTRTDSG